MRFPRLKGRPGSTFKFTLVLTLCIPLLGSQLFLSLWPSSAAGGMGITSSGYVWQRFLQPINYETAGSYYDQNNQLKSASYKFHHGLDISDGCVPGAYPVFAPAAGRVAIARYLNDGYGSQVVIDHGYNLGGNGKYTYSFYAHMGKHGGASYIQVAQGQMVTAGQLIGYQGDDGNTFGSCPPPYGTHLDWEIRVATSPVPYSSSMRYSLVAASPDFYTGLQLTQGDPSPLTRVTAGNFGTALPGPPVPVWPGNNESIGARGVTLRWQAPSDTSNLSGYTLRVSTSSNPETQPWLVDSRLPVTTTQTAFFANSDGTYWWHLRSWGITPSNPGPWVSKSFRLAPLTGYPRRLYLPQSLKNYERSG